MGQKKEFAVHDFMDSSHTNLSWDSSLIPTHMLQISAHSQQILFALFIERFDKNTCFYFVGTHSSLFIRNPYKKLEAETPEI